MIKFNFDKNLRVIKIEQKEYDISNDIINVFKKAISGQLDDVDGVNIKRIESSVDTAIIISEFIDSLNNNEYCLSKNFAFEVFKIEGSFVFVKENNNSVEFQICF